MDNINDLLSEYLLNDYQLLDLSKSWQLNSFLLNEENWKIFFDTSFDTVLLSENFNTKSEEQRCDLVKFAVDCFLAFVQANFTGPPVSKPVEEFLNKEMFSAVDFRKLLVVNNEDINVNTKYPVLLVLAKLVFKCCVIHNTVNNCWYWRSIIIHQQVLDELSPTLLSEADFLYKQFYTLSLNESIKALLDIEIAQLYLLYRHVSKSKCHIEKAKKTLGIKYDLKGKLGKRTRFQEKELAQLCLEVIIENKNLERSEVDDSNVPKNIPLVDDVRLNAISFSEQSDGGKIILTNIEQKLLITVVHEMLVSRPADELVSEELQPYIDMVLNQKNTYSVRVSSSLIRCKLECKNRRTIERSLVQCDEVINSYKRENPAVISRVLDVFGTGLPPMWKVESQYADLLLNIGLVKNSLDIYLRIQLWEEVIVCYTILKLRQKATEIIQQQLNSKPSVKLWCLLGDSTDDITCYEKAWEMSKRRSHRAQRHWGNHLFTRKKYEECIPHFEKSLSINPLQTNVWFRLGYAALETENWQTAATAYRRYTTLEPDGFEAWNNLAQAYIKIGNKRNAHHALLEALKCNFDNWKVWENLLVVSCDISNFSDVIRAYHRLLDLKEKYLNLEVLNVLVYNVCVENEGSNKELFKSTKELFGRITAIYPGDGLLWQLYSNLAPNNLGRAQRLQKAFRGFCNQNMWDKNPTDCKKVLDVCEILGDLTVTAVKIGEFDPKDPIVNSVKLNLSSALAVAKKNDWEEIRVITKLVTETLKNMVKVLEDHS